MRILAPVNKPEEVAELIKEGADELYCGVMPGDWKATYTNIASPNRREWSSANLAGFAEAKKVADIAHAHGVRVYLTLNAFYTQPQYPVILEQVRLAKNIGMDAFIIADLGLLLALKEKEPGIEIHISNNGTTFNSETVRFYKSLGASRIILPRHLMIDEIAELVEGENEVSFEVFILNSGCRNIDGFCTFHHGVNEITHPFLWDLFKRFNFDRHLLEAVRKLPVSISSRIKSNISGIDSACLLNYEISEAAQDRRPQKSAHPECNAISRSFNLLSGIDPCGACDLYRLDKIGIKSVKIVGRNYSSSKKVKDVRFLKKVLLYLGQNPRATEEEFRSKAKAEYLNTYKMACNDLCYRSPVVAKELGSGKSDIYF